jgi:hypothetical protein
MENLDEFKRKISALDSADAGAPQPSDDEIRAQLRDTMDAGVPAGAPMQSNAIADTGSQRMSDAPSVQAYAPRNPVDFGREYVMPEVQVQGAIPPRPGPGIPGFNQYDRGVLSGYDTQAQHQNELNDAEVGKQQGLAHIEDREAMRQQREALGARQDAYRAQQDAKDYLARTDKVNEDIAASRIRNPLDSASTGDRIRFGIGAALGAIGGDIFGHSNYFMDNLNKQVDRDISLQEKNLDNKKSYFGNRNTIYGQMHAANQDRESTNLQYRSAMLEAAKHQIASQVAANDIPSVRANGKLLTDKINMEQAQLKRTMFQQKQAQAAAAAAAQRAAEAAQFEREYKMAELGLKAEEIGKKGSGDLENRVQGYGKALQDKDVQARENAIASLKQNMKPGEGIPGIGVLDDIRDAAFRRPSGIGALNPAAWALNKAFGLSPQEKINRNNWEQMKLAYVHEVTGAGGPPEEKQMIMRALEGSKTPEEQKAALDKAQDYIDRYKATARGTFGSDAEEAFKRRLMPELYKRPNGQ